MAIPTFLFCQSWAAHMPPRWLVTLDQCGFAVTRHTNTAEHSQGGPLGSWNLGILFSGTVSCWEFCILHRVGNRRSQKGIWEFYCHVSELLSCYCFLSYDRPNDQQPRNCGGTGACSDDRRRTSQTVEQTVAVGLYRRLHEMNLKVENLTLINMNCTFNFVVFLIPTEGCYQVIFC